MKKVVFALVLLLNLCFSIICFAGIRDYPSIAVLNFENKSSVPNNLTFDDVSIVTDFMIEELVNCGRFNVMERQQLKAITDEHYLNMTGLVDTTTAAEIGRLAGVQYLVYGSVTNLSTKESTAGYQNSVHGGLENNQHIVNANINVRVIDVETGRIVLASRGKGASTSTDTKAYLDRRKETTYLYEDEYGNLLYSDVETTGEEHTFVVGTTEVSKVQVHNALAKAVEDAVYDKKTGLIARLDGKSKL